MIVLFVVPFLATAVSLRSEDIFQEPAAFPFDVQSSTAPAKPVTPSRFVQQMSRLMDWPADKLHKLELTGFGRTEMILLVMMEKKTAEDWDKLVKEREKGAALREMAGKREMPYNDLFRKAGALKADIDAAVDALPAEIKKSTESTKMHS